MVGKEGCQLLRGRRSRRCSTGPPLLRTSSDGPSWGRLARTCLGAAEEARFPLVCVLKMQTHIHIHTNAHVTVNMHMFVSVSGCEQVCCGSHQVFLSSVQRHKLLVVLEFSSCSEIGQFVDGASVFSNHTHDISRFDVTVNNTILSQVVHTCHCRHNNGSQTTSKH